MDDCIGLLSPGEMGAAVGRALEERGLRVVVALDGRSPATVARAVSAGLEDVGTVERLVAVSDLVVSIVPPACAIEVAQQLRAAMAATGAGPTVLDANAISPERARVVASIVEDGGGRYLDGGIVGGPPSSAGRTDLFVSGPGASALAERLSGEQLVVTPIGADPVAASALKMCFAGWTKVTAALAVTIRGTARHYGVDDALVALWQRRVPAVLARSEAVGDLAHKAWRWTDEMTEIAKTIEAAGLPGGAPAAAALLYERLAPLRTQPDPGLDEVLAALAR